MNRLLVRRCSMSSIEEEDEATMSDELTQQQDEISFVQQQQQQSDQKLLPIPPQSPSVLDWDSEMSESEQEFDDNDEDPTEDGVERAANRALKSFMQTSSRARQAPITSNNKNNNNGSHSPSSIHLHDDDDDSAELDAIISELRDFKVQFEEFSSQTFKHSTNNNNNNNNNNNSMEHPSSTSSSSSSSSSTSSTTNGCVYELRTLEDQLEAALASLTLTINDCTTITSADCQQRSSGSSACSSGLGDDIGNDSLGLFSPTTNHQSSTTTVSFTSKIGPITSMDDCDSAFSDSGSTDKVTPPNLDESTTCRSMITITSSNSNQPACSRILDQEDSLTPNHPSKLLVRTYNDDGSTKSILVDDSMSIRDVLFVLVHKNHREPDIDFALVEILPDLHMERIFEDHQKLTEAILMWPTVSSNRLIFTKRSEKYALFRTTTSILGKDEAMVLYDELFKTPDLEGIIYLKEKSRKSWKKHLCVLRSSGLYFVPKGKSKKDLVCLAKFENVELFFGLGWKKKFKSPSDFCFALKHPLIQKKSSKYIKYMCVETKKEFDRWISSIRIAKFGQQLKINHFLMDKAMNIYRSSGRFAAVCAARTATPSEQSNGEMCHPPTPCPSIRDRQVFNRTPVLPSNGNHYYAMDSSVQSNRQISQQSPSASLLSTSTMAGDGNNDDQIDDDDNDENSPIKSASYMDELRQRLERVLNDSPAPGSSPVPPPQPTTPAVERHSCLPISKSFRLPIQPIPIHVQSSIGYRPSPIISRMPVKTQVPASLLTPPPPPPPPLKGISRGTSLIAPSKLKLTTGHCLSSTENLRSPTSHLPHPSPPITVGSTPLPRKQLHQSFQMSDRHFSYRTTPSNQHTNNGTSQHSLRNASQQQMSKSFIMPTKRDDQRSVSSLSIASKSDSLNLDDTDFPLPSPTFLEGLVDLSNNNNNNSKVSHSLKPKPTVISSSNVTRAKISSSTTLLKKPITTVFRTNGRPQPPLPVKTGLTPASLKLSSSVSQPRLLSKSTVSSTSTNSLINGKLSIGSVGKAVPPVPPRKSSIPRPSFTGPSPFSKPQPPQRDSSNNLLFHKAHVSHF